MYEELINNDEPLNDEEWQKKAFKEEWIDGHRYVLFLDEDAIKSQDTQYVYDARLISPSGPPVDQACGDHVYRYEWINGKRYVAFLHDDIMQPQEGQYVHHIDGNGFNFLPENLEIRNRKPHEYGYFKMN